MEARLATFIVIIAAFCLFRYTESRYEMPNPWFSRGKDYHFEFNGEGSYIDVNMTVQCSVVVKVLSEDKAAKTQEILLVFPQKPSILYSHDSTSRQGMHMDSSDFSNWFSALRDIKGNIVTVSYPRQESSGTFEFKRMIAALLSYNLQGNSPPHSYVSSESGVNGRLTISNALKGDTLQRSSTVNIGGFLYTMEGVVEFGNGQLQRVALKEHWALQKSPFASVTSSEDLTSSSQLELQEVKDAVGKPPLRPDNLVTSTLDVSSRSKYQPSLKDAEEELTPLVQCIASGTGPEKNNCSALLVFLLSRLTSEDLRSVANKFLGQQSSEASLMLLKSLVLVPQKVVPGILADELSRSLFEGSYEYTHGILTILPSLKATPTDKLVGVLFSISEESDTKLSQQAYLMLGVMARSTMQDNPALSKNIVDRIQSTLKEHTGLLVGDRTRSQRDTDSGNRVHATLTLVDALGNAGSPHSLDVLMEHATGKSGQPLSVVHSTVMALRKYDCQKSADVLLDIAYDDVIHSTVRHTAANLYLDHPKMKRDVGEQVKRSVEGLSFDVAVPVVRWSERFGNHNISTELNKLQRNSFSISSDDYSTSYQFSLYDDTWISSHLELSGGDNTVELLRTQLCYEGTISYGINMLKDFHQNYSVDTLADYTPLMNTITSDFHEAVEALTSTGGNSTGFIQAIRSAATRLASGVDVTGVVQQFNNAVTRLGGVDQLKTTAETIANAIDAVSRTNTQAVSDLAEVLNPLLDWLDRNYPRVLFTHFDNFPEVDSGAPLRTLNEISAVLWMANISLSRIEQHLMTIQDLVASNGNYSSVFDPTTSLYETILSLKELKSSLQYGLNQDYNNESTIQSLETLQSSIGSHLDVAIATLLQATEDLVGRINQFTNVFIGTRNAFRELVHLYETSRSEVDIVFGLRFNTSFPKLIKPCDTECGCGGFPTTIRPGFNLGVDLVISDLTKVYSPVGGVVSLTPAKPQYSGSVVYDAASSVEVVPVGDNLRDHRIVISNIVPHSDIRSGTFLAAGATLGEVSSSVTCGNTQFIHLEVLKTINSTTEVPVDPTPFLQPILDPTVMVTLDCNSVAVLESGNVVDRMNLTSVEPERVLLGEPLIVDLRILPHEFPQPVDYTLSGAGSYASSSPVTFSTESTSIMVGPNLVEFEFSAMGSYSVNFSASVNALSRQMQVNILPSVAIDAVGSSRVGNAVYSRVSLNGSLFIGGIPSSLEQSWVSWPLFASSSMDLVLSPSTLTLTSTLLQQTGFGEEEGEEVLESATLWQYSIPPVNRNEYVRQVSTADTSAPLFSDLAEGEGINCSVRQLPWRLHDYPAFELDFKVKDPNSLLFVELTVLATRTGDIMLRRPHLRGPHVVGSYNLTGTEMVEFVLVARNLQGLTSTSHCSLLRYDRSPPLGRITPSHPVSSHPSRLEALVVLFDEYGLDAVQQVAVGTVSGEYGNDVMDWREFSTALLQTPPTLRPFSFKREGILTTNILKVVSLDKDDCERECLSIPACLSYDHSTPDVLCVLHSGIEGPVSLDGYENTFWTPPLQSASGFYHYERLGVGQSAILSFTDLSLQHGRKYFVNVHLVNRLGYRNVASSPEILVDFTPPEPGLLRNVWNDTILSDGCDVSIFQSECVSERPGDNHRVIVDGDRSETVFNGPIPLVDAMYTSACQIMSANWNGFHDDESGIMGYAWCIGTDIGSCDVLPFEDPHRLLPSRETWTNSALAVLDPNLQDGDYYITVRVESNVEYGGPLVTTLHHSTPYQVDTVPPEVADMMLEGYSADQNELRVSYTAIDSGSGLYDMSVAIGASPSDSSLLGWTSIPISSSPVSIPVTIPDGVPSYIKIRATDRVGLSTVSLFPEVLLVDRSPPIAGNVRDGNAAHADRQYQSERDEICVNFDGFSDPNTGISTYWWAILASEDDSMIASRYLTAGEMLHQVACEDGLSLRVDTHYYSTLVAFNGAIGGLDGDVLNISVSSDGVYIDVTPPAAGVVRDGLSEGEDVDYSSCFSCVWANWNGFVDNESGIDHYQITVNHKSFDSAVFTKIYESHLPPSASTLSLSRFNFVTGDSVKVQVRAWNGAGLSTMAESSGVVIDLTPPLVTSVRNGPHAAITDGQYLSNTSALTLTWQASDSESGLNQTKLVLFQVLEGMHVQLHPSPHSAETFELIDPRLMEWTVYELALNRGATYVAVFEFVNGAGLSTVREAPMFTVDSDPPTISDLVIVGGETVMGSNGSEVIAIATDDRIEVTWAGRDADSGVSEYVLHLEDEYNVSVLPGGVESIVVEGSHTVVSRLLLTSGNATDGPFYFLRLVAVDKADVMSEPLMSSPIFVRSGPTAGIVTDGEIPDQDIDYTHNTATVTAHFKGFHSSICGGIQHYTWSIGTDTEGSEVENVLETTTRGLSEGRGQVYLGNLADYHGRRLYVTVIGYDGCGGTYKASSDGFIIDTTPPVFDEIVLGGNNIDLSELHYGRTEQQYYQSDEHLFARWRSSDGESGLVEDYVVRVGSYPGGDDIVGDFYTPTGSLQNRTYSPELEGIPQHITLVTENRAGLRTEIGLPPVVMDTSPPQQGELSCPSFIIGDPCNPLHSVFAPLACSWSGFHDPHSPISSYSIMIGSSPGSQDVLSPIFFPQGVSWYAAPLLEYSPGVGYFVTLTAINEVGLKILVYSSAIFVETTPPVPPQTVNVVANYLEANFSDLENALDSLPPSKCILETDSITLEWSEFVDNESNISSHQFSIGRSHGASDIVEFTNIQPTVVMGVYRYTVSNIGDTLRSIGREEVYVNIRAFNAANFATVASSGPLFVATSDNNDESWIYDGCRGNQIDDIDYQTSTTEYCGYFHIGVNCPLRSAEWALEGIDGELAVEFTRLTDLSPVTSIGGSKMPSNTYSVSSDQLRLYHNETYRLIVRGYDVTGRRHLLVSDGVFVTIHPVQQGKVRDGLLVDYDLKYQVSTTSLSAHWSDFGDGSAEQEIEYYQVAVGTDRRYSSTKSNIVPFTNVGSATSHTFTGLNLVAMDQVYYVTVRAYAVSGASVDVTSNGVTVGFNTSIIPGVISVPAYQSDNASFSARWTEFESDVPIRSYQWGVSTSQFSEVQLREFCSNISRNYEEELDVFGLSNVGLDTAITANLSLHSGMEYFFILRAVDQGSKCVTISSSGTIVDATLPIARGIFVGSNESRYQLTDAHDSHVTYLGDRENIPVLWEEFRDYEAPMDHYEVAIFQQSQCGRELSNASMLTPFYATGLVTTYTFEYSSISLRSSVPYMVVIKGVNMAGLYTMGYSNPFVVTMETPLGGDVKDGPSWDDDRVYQSSLDSLVATFSHALLRPYVDAGKVSSDPCPRNVTFSLDGTDSKWSAFQPSRVAGIIGNTIVYEADNDTLSLGVRGTTITMSRNNMGQNVFTGVVRYPAAFSIEDGDLLSVSIAAAVGEESLEVNSVTSLVLYEGPDDFLPQFDLNLLLTNPNVFEGTPHFSALGFSLYNRNASGDGVGPKVVLWYFRNSPRSVPIYSSAEVFVNVSETHTYSLKFTWDEQDFNPSYWVDLRIDDELTASLHGIQSFTEQVDIALSLFNQNGFLPSVDATGDPSVPPEVEATFTDIVLPLRTSTVCRYGQPMHSWEDPFIRVEAGVGTAPFLTNVKPYEVVLVPCTPCLPGPCENFSCNASCTDYDPYTFTFTITNLTLAVGSSEDQSLSGSSQLYSSISLDGFIPAVYYVTVMGITASGASAISASNGVVIDTSPPRLVDAIQHFDMAFNPSQPVNYQGNNDTISASWEFRDDESGIVEYFWSIGTSPEASDVQSLTSVGLNRSATNSGLEGVLSDNTTYYVSVVAVNGAGLHSLSTSTGITVISTVLNETELRSLVEILYVEDLLVPSVDDPDIFTAYEVAMETDSAGISWNDVPEDVDEISWSIGSQPLSDDIFPSTLVSYSGSTYAEFKNGYLFINGTAFASLAEVLAIAETKVRNDRDNLLSIQPGSVFYHSLEFCNVAHKCTDVRTRPGIVVRPRDYFVVVDNNGDIAANLYQMQSTNYTVAETPIPDREATVVLTASEALPINTSFAAGILSEEDLRRFYRTSSLYISNPYTTMGLTAASVSRRFTNIGGPSFYVSFLGQNSLSAPLKIQVSFDSNVDWTLARPTLLFWDTHQGVWREVNETCTDTPTTVDWVSYTLTTYMCSTSDTSRRKRQNTNTTAFLERATHFVVGQIGSTIINTAPRLQLPDTPTDIQQNPVVYKVDLSTMYTDDEMDSVLFHLLTAPQLGTVELSTSGQLKYTPCLYCIGLEELTVRIIENSPEVDVPLSDSGMLLLNIVNKNDPPNRFLYDNLTEGTILPGSEITVFLDNNRTAFTSVALIGGYDFDGFHDDLSVRITGARRGTASSELWLDVVAVSESLPVQWPANSSEMTYRGYMTFIGVNITYLPSDPAYVGQDSLTVSIQDRGALFSNPLRISVTMFDSPCVNGGRCRDPIGRNCSCDCPSGYLGNYCEISPPAVVSGGGCPEGVPLMTCDGDPCSEASCPSHPSAQCRPNYCGSCKAEWYSGDSLVQCHADEVDSICNKRVDDSVSVILKCNGASCNCPQQPFSCPADSILKEIRVDDCCVQYECVCPNISCPLLMECGRGVQPNPTERGHGYPGYCCPMYDFQDIDECELSNGLCSDGCRNEPYSHQCTCGNGVTLADNGRTCGVCLYNGLQYFYGDRVKIGCNWCECVSDMLSEERWQCTNQPCSPGCLSNGEYRGIGDSFSYGIANCTCEPTDSGADWTCIQHT